MNTNLVGFDSSPRLPMLFFPEKNWKKLFAYADIALGEISGLGTVKLHENGVDFIVDEIFILNQVSSIGSTDLNSDSIAKFITDLILEGKDPSSLKLWFHSHGNLGVFWSTTDNTTIQGFSNASYMFSIVVNKRFEYKARLDIFKPLRLSVELEVNFENDFLGIDRVEIEKEVTEKVKILPIQTPGKEFSINKLGPRKRGKKL